MSEFIPGSKRDVSSYLPDIHRLLPQDPVAERGVLSCLVLSPAEVHDACRDRGITADYFHIPGHAIIFAEAVAILEKKKPLDFVTLNGALRDTGQLDAVGGVAAISELWTFLPTAANAIYYLEILQQKQTARRIIRIGTEYAAKAYDCEAVEPDRRDRQISEVEKLLNEFQRDICAVEMGAKDDSQSVIHIKAGVLEAAKAIQALYLNRGQEVLGVPFGYTSLDRMTGGMQPGQLVLIAGRASMGKSAMLWDMAQHIAEKRGPVLGFSLEMNRKEIAERYIFWDAKIDICKLRNGFLSTAEIAAVMESASRLAKTLREWVDETGAIAIEEVRAKARRFKQKHPDMAAIVIDYMQLMKSRSRRAQNSKNDEISEVSAGLKALAKELGLPIIAGAQINREGDTAGKPPKLSNLKDSGSLEQDADIVVILHRPGYYSKEDADMDKVTAFLAKQRQGPTGDVALTWTPWARIVNPAEEHMYSNNPDHRQQKP